MEFLYKMPAWVGGITILTLGFYAFFSVKYKKFKEQDLVVLVFAVPSFWKLLVLSLKAIEIWAIRGVALICIDYLGDIDTHLLAAGLGAGTWLAGSKVGKMFYDLFPKVEEKKDETKSRKEP